MRVGECAIQWTLENFYKPLTPNPYTENSRKWVMRDLEEWRLIWECGERNRE